MRSEKIAGSGRRGLLLVAATGVWLAAGALLTVAAYYCYLVLVNGFLLVNQDRYVLRVVTGGVVLLLLVLWTVAVVALQRWLADARTPRTLAVRSSRALGAVLLVLGASYAIATYGLTRYVS